MKGEGDGRRGEGAYPAPSAAGGGARLGLTETDTDEALPRAGRVWGRGDWEIVEVERLTGSDCPVDGKDRRVLAAEAHISWAYTVYRRAP